ncbi:MAG TPA: alanine racemase [Thermoleophilaceae bacterium]|nr:alanine racemase [Thermoleophilaceae bacterium]
MAAQAAARALARVSVGAVERNCAHLRSLLTGDAELCAVVKADGYGHGAVECARAARRGGATWLAVATAGEAALLRAAGLSGRLLVMGSLTRTEVATALAADADVVVWEPEFARSLAERVGESGVPARIHVKLDSGMGRLGAIDSDRARAVADIAASDQRLELVGLMTHFATADEPGDDHFPAQLARFTAFADELSDVHPGVIVHAANSAAVYRDPASHFDMARCGVAIYGLDPFQEDPVTHGLEPALALEVAVGAVRRFEAGWTAGYGRRWTASEPTWVATLPIGYGDGWRRALTNDCDVLIGGVRRPLVGTVSMDNVTVDLGGETDVAAGGTAVLIGAQDGERILAEEVARRLGTINYEVTCGLTARVPRTHEP